MRFIRSTIMCYMKCKAFTFFLHNCGILSVQNLLANCLVLDSKFSAAWFKLFCNQFWVAKCSEASIHYLFYVFQTARKKVAMNACTLNFVELKFNAVRVIKSTNFCKHYRKCIHSASFFSNLVPLQKSLSEWNNYNAKLPLFQTFKKHMLIFASLPLVIVEEVTSNSCVSIDKFVYRCKSTLKLHQISKKSFLHLFLLK